MGSATLGMLAVETQIWADFNKGLDGLDGTWQLGAGYVAGAAAVAWIVNRVLNRQGKVLAQAVARGDLSPEANTRLRFIRRLATALILAFGIALALAQFESFNELATSLLASGAIAAAVIGFAARQTLANLVAGMMIAVSQPLRVGDWVTFEDVYGEVVDVRLNYTYLRTPANQRVIIPNEKLTTGILRNDTLATSRLALEVSLWMPLATDTERAIAVLQADGDCRVRVAETSPDGVRLAVTGAPVAPGERAGLEADLRTRCLALLRAEHLLPASPEQESEPVGRT